MTGFKALALVAVALVGSAGAAFGDPWKDESRGRWRGGYERYDDDDDDRERKIKIRTADGCEIERKWKKGEYEEKVKCKGRDARRGFSAYGYPY